MQILQGMRGTIARAYLYMREYQDIFSSELEKARYKKWHQQYPPDGLEITWNSKVKATQGNGNLYIENYSPINLADH